MLELPKLIRTPKTLSLSLANGAYFDWDVEGHEFRILLLSGVTSIKFAFNDDAFQSAHPNVGYPVGPGLQFEKVRLYNDGGTTAVMDLVVSDSVVSAEMSDITTILGDIRDELQGTAGAGTYAQATVGVTQSQIVAASTSRGGGIFQAARTNTGTIYLGFDNTVTSSKTFCSLTAGGSWSVDDYRGTVHAIASAAGQLLNYGVW